MTRVYGSLHGPAGACRNIFSHTNKFFAPVRVYSGRLLAAAIKNKKSSTRSKMREATMAESCKQYLIVGSDLASLGWRCSHNIIILVLSCVLSLVFVLVDLYYERKRRERRWIPCDRRFVVRGRLAIYHPYTK